MQTLITSQGAFRLARYPDREADPLRPWDAADEYLLHHLAESDATISTPLIVNDRFGVLSTALAQHRPTLISDNYQDHLGAVANLGHNQGLAGSICCLSSLDPLPTAPGMVLLKLPKNLALLEYQLRRLRSVLRPGQVIIAAGMTRHVRTGVLERFERLIGPTTTSLARKRARLIFARFDPDLELSPEPTPTQYSLPTGEVLTNHANVFSRNQLDLGTRTLTQALSDAQRVGDAKVVDLGCGNGALGITAAQRNPAAHITFVDVSFMAIASAQANFQAAFGQRPARFVVGDGLGALRSGEPIPADSVDLVLNNPPFHSNHAISLGTATQMFRDAHRVLRPGGELWVVGNRHLPYPRVLRGLFAHCRVITHTRKFHVFRATR